jgi:hypothetical protein
MFGEVRYVFIAIADIVVLLALLSRFYFALQLPTA